MPAATIRSRSRRRCGWSISCARRRRTASRGRCRARAAARGLARVILTERCRQSAAHRRRRDAVLLRRTARDRSRSMAPGRTRISSRALQEEMSKQGRPLTEMFRNVSAYVRTVTKGEQIPQVVSDWTADVVLGVAGQPRRVSGDGERRRQAAVERRTRFRAALGSGFSQVRRRLHRQGRHRRSAARRHERCRTGTRPQARTCAGLLDQIRPRPRRPRRDAERVSSSRPVTGSRSKARA